MYKSPMTIFEPKFVWIFVNCKLINDSALAHPGQHDGNIATGVMQFKVAI
jgi:hypothetical protein